MALKNQAGLIKIIDAIECMEKSLSCAICLEISSEPVETPCGHLFCRNCIQKVLSHPGESCPVCKFNLTRRSVSSSSHMELCIQQLSKLVDAVRSDTDIDITSCLKTHYKKRAFLPSASSSSPHSQQEIQNQIPPLESDNNTKKNPQAHEDSTDLVKHDIRSASKEPSVEYPFHKPRDQTINNLSCKIITKKSQLEAKTSRLTATNPLRVQNENVLPPENTGALNKPKSATETHQFDPNVNEETDTFSEENRPCLKDISTVNLNRSVTDQSTKTWSRVAKFGKELRRKTGRNSPRIHKKPKLSVNVRDKSVLLNSSHDHSIDREKSGEDRVDHDSDTNNSMLNRHEDDINISVSDMKKAVGENVNPARLNQNDNIISKNKKPETLTTLNSKTCNETAAFETNVQTDERLPNSGSGISEVQINRGAKKMTKQIKKLSDVLLLSDCVKTVIPVNNSDKQSSEEKGKASEASSAINSGKSLFSANKGRKQSSEEKEKVSEDSSAADSGKSLFSGNKKSNQSSEEKERVLESTAKANSGKLVNPENKNSKRIHSDDSSTTELEKLVDTESKGSKRLSEERGKLPESLYTSAEKEAETARAVRKNINHAADGERHTRRTKRTQYANVVENVVRFKKLGHLFRLQRKRVPFLYLGSTKPQVSETFSDSASICKLCSSCQLSDKSTLLQKQRLESSGLLSRAKSFESVSFNSRKLLPLPQLSTSRINKFDRKENHFQIPSVPEEQTIPPKNDLQSRFLSKDDTEKTLPDENESSIIGRKRKRSESSDRVDQCTEERNEKRVSKKPSEPLDHEVQYREEESEKRASKKRSEPLDNEVQYTEEESEQRVSKKRSEPLDHEVQYTEEESEKRLSKKQSKSPDRENQCTENQSEECVSRKRSEASDHDDQSTKNQSRTRASHELTQTENDKYFGVDSLLNATLHSQALPDKFPQTEQLAVQEKDTTDVTNSPEHESVNVEPVEFDCRIKNAFQEANITLRGNGIRRLPQPMPVTTPNVPKNVNCTESRDLISPKDCERSRTYLDVIGKNSDVHEYEEGSEINLSRASMMDITAEELLFKKFEENLFGPAEPVNIQKRSENNTVLKENTTDSLAVAKPTLISEPLDQSVSVPKTTLVGHNQSLEMEDFVELTPTEQNLNRLNNPPEIIPNKESAGIQQNAEKAQNCDEEKTAETRVRGSRQNEEAKMHTPAQSVSKIRPIYQSTPKSSQVSTDRYRLTVYRQMNEKANSPIGVQGCILCSGLTSKQSEEVKYLSGLFNMQYTKKFTENVTHIIVKTTGENNGACKTLKYLQGVAYRKWIVNFNWIVDCVAQKKLLNEELYEVVDSTTLIAGPKKARTGEKRPFDGFVFYCVEPFQNISVPDYEDLLRQMGATVVGSLKDLAAEESIFKIIALQADCHEKKIIEWHQITKAVPVAQEWIVECISQYRLVSLLPFLQELVPQDILDLGFPEELIQDDDSDFMYDMST